MKTHTTHTRIEQPHHTHKHIHTYTLTQMNDKDTNACLHTLERTQKRTHTAKNDLEIGGRREEEGVEGE